MAAVIVAAATPPGRSALAIVRLSGPRLDGVVGAVARPLQGLDLAPGPPRRVALVDGAGAFDDGVAWWRSGPHTATGEAVCELTVHGNPLIVERLVQACVAAGARVARPGEFTRRALLAGKLDLLSAEAVDQVIRATSPGGLALGRAGLDGRLTAMVDALRSAVVAQTAELEARLDHGGDELALQSDGDLRQALLDTACRCEELAETFAAGRVLVDGARVALVGPVNAGKSSLFNALLGQRRALVHERPGTTRDVVEARTMLAGLAVTLLDTAGERETDDPVEVAGQALAEQLIADADLWLVVVRAGPDTPTAEDRELLARCAARPHLVVVNGVDQHPGVAMPDSVATSALEGTGLDTLRAAISDALGVRALPELMVASARQRDLLLTVARAARAAQEALDGAGVAVAADALTRGLEQLDVLSGADTREDVLDAVFARFCIGK